MRPTQLQLIQAIGFCQIQLQHSPGKLYTLHIINRLRWLGYSYVTDAEFYDAVGELGYLILGDGLYSWLV